MYLLLKIFFFVVLLSFVVHSEEPVTITGTITDTETGEPIANVNIMINGTTYGAASDQQGNFKIENVPPGTYRVEFSHINYIPLSITQIFLPGLESDVSTELQPRPIALEKIEVVDTVEQRFIPDRTGYIITREDIQRSGAVSFGDVINRFIPRTRVREEGGNLYIQLQLRTTIAQRYDRGDPFPLIILDGMPLGTNPIGLANVVTPSDIAHVQVVRPPDSEAIYGSEATHGAIIIETIRLTEDDFPMSPLLRRLVVGGFASIMFYLAILR